jgi:pimeloyl-ACP methyl ester carboxylesterase
MMVEIFMPTGEHKFVQANGIQIHYVTQGEGTPVILLHGFPEFWIAWRHQIPALAKHFQVIVPDLRGYGQTERPSKVADYNISLLAADIECLIKALGFENAHIIGHDWGGAIAWNLALQYPEVVDRLVVLNSPHPVIFSKALRSNFRQILKSWYIFFFQLPHIPELIFRMNTQNMIRGLLRNSTIQKDTFSDTDIEHYVKALNEPGAMTAALNYYRAAFRKRNSITRVKKIDAPTLLIWGEKDIALGKELTYDMESLFTGPFSIEYILNCGHFVNEEQPELVNHLLMDHLMIK